MVQFIIGRVTKKVNEKLRSNDLSYKILTIPLFKGRLLIKLKWRFINAGSPIKKLELEYVNERGRRSEANCE